MSLIVCWWVLFEKREYTALQSPQSMWFQLASIYRSIYLSIHPSVYLLLSTCLSLSNSLNICFSLSTHPAVYPSIHLSSIHLPVCPSIHQSVYLPSVYHPIINYLFVYLHLSIYLSGHSTLKCFYMYIFRFLVLLKLIYFHVKVMVWVQMHLLKMMHLFQHHYSGHHGNTVANL